MQMYSSRKLRVKFRIAGVDGRILFVVRIVALETSGSLVQFQPIEISVEDCLSGMSETRPAPDKRFSGF
jgi:hypothetical protein